LLSTSVVSFGSGITVNGFTVNSTTRITVSITITPGAAIGKHNVSVTTLGGTASLANGFTVIQEQISTTTPHGSSMPGNTATAPQGPVSLPSVSVKSASLSATKVAPGTPVTVTADVANTGTVNGTGSIKVYVNGEMENSQGVTVNSGSSTPVTFTISRNEPGTYSVYVGGASAGSFTVDQFADPNIILYISGALLIFAFIIGLLFILRRRQPGH
ncbi:MAG: CARDB domain-containing protein, partial [Dehalococcoidia bacterium]